MSERESKFMQILTTVLGGFILAIGLGVFSFYIVTVKAQASQDVINEKLDKKVETMRIEWREDVKEIKMNIDKLTVSISEKK